MSNADDVKMLSELLRWADENDGAESRFNVAAFEDMLRRISVSGRELNPKQRSWVRDIHEKIIGTPHYENLVSSGRVPTGKPVETPPMLRRENLPTRPPRRQRSHCGRDPSVVGACGGTDATCSCDCLTCSPVG